MAYPTWPVSVKQVPLVDSWSMPDIYQDPRVTDMEGANKRARTRPGDDMYTVSFNLLMTKAQWQTLKTFFLVDCGRGTSRFNTRIWNGSQMINALVQHKDKPVPTAVEPKVMVALSYWVYPNG